MLLLPEAGYSEQFLQGCLEARLLQSWCVNQIPLPVVDLNAHQQSANNYLIGKRHNDHVQRTQVTSRTQRKSLIRSAATRLSDLLNPRSQHISVLETPSSERHLVRDRSIDPMNLG